MGCAVEGWTCVSGVRLGALSTLAAGGGASGALSASSWSCTLSAHEMLLLFGRERDCSADGDSASSSACHAHDMLLRKPSSKPLSGLLSSGCCAIVGFTTLDASVNSGQEGRVVGLFSYFFPEPRLPVVTGDCARKKALAGKAWHR